MLEKLPDAVGEALGALRAGRADTVFHAIDQRPGMGALTLDRLAFGEHRTIPGRRTADGSGLLAEGVPPGAADNASTRGRRRRTGCARAFVGRPLAPEPMSLEPSR